MGRCRMVATMETRNTPKRRRPQTDSSPPYVLLGIGVCAVGVIIGISHSLSTRPQGSSATMPSHHTAVQSSASTFSANSNTAHSAMLPPTLATPGVRVGLLPGAPPTPEARRLHGLAPSAVLAPKHPIARATASPAAAATAAATTADIVAEATPTAAPVEHTRHAKNAVHDEARQKHAADDLALATAPLPEHTRYPVTAKMLGEAPPQPSTRRMPARAATIAAAPSQASAPTSDHLGVSTHANAPEPVHRAHVSSSPATSVVDGYLHALMHGNESLAYHYLGAAPGDKNASLVEEAFIDRSSTITSLTSQPAGPDAADVQAEVSGSRGLYVASYHVEMHDGRQIITSHDYIKP